MRTRRRRRRTRRCCYLTLGVVARLGLRRILRLLLALPRLLLRLRLRLRLLALALLLICLIGLVFLALIWFLPLGLLLRLVLLRGR